jgi:putative DNA primase/helicase
MIPDEEIERLKDIDLAELILSYGVDLKRAGSEWKACCPFHSEDSPSFSVVPNKNFFYCFGCGASGNPIDFVMLYQNVDFKQAVQMLGAGQGPADAPKRKPRTRPEPKPSEWQVQAIAAGMDMPPPAVLPVMVDKQWTDVPVVAAWPYRDAGGNLLAYDLRIEPEPGKKQIIPVTWQINTSTGEAKWRQGSLPKPRTLYGAELLADNPNHQILVVEGCKTTDAGRRLFAGMPVIVVSWMGGGKAVKFADWSLLAGRKVVVWPDCDSKTNQQTGEYLPYSEQPGMAAALEICEQLPDTCDARIVAVPLPGELVDGWDLADAEAEGWDGARAVDFLRKNLHLADSIKRAHEHQQEPAPAPPPEHYAEAPPPDDSYQPDRGEPLPPAVDDQPFRILGWDRLTAHYLPHNSEQIIALTASQHTKNNLIALAPLDYWQRSFPSSKKADDAVDWGMVNNALIQSSQRFGIYDPDLVRGRGAWWEDGRWAVHLGDRVIIDGHSFKLREAPTRYIYEKSAAMQIEFEEPLSGHEAVKLMKICERLRWIKPIDGKLLAGWVFLAPICGAIEWRPHIWITGGAGSGKSTVMRHVIGRCLKGICLQVEGDTSEAGIRQALVHDARPVVFDEFESERRKAAERVQDVLAMVTRASSESDAQLLKGSGDGKATGYKTRAMFAFSSIAVNLQQFAAATRVTVLDLYGEPESERSLATYNSIMAEVFDTLTPDYIQRLQARAIRLIPVIRKNAQTFAEAAAIALKSRRMGDQIGTLLAGVYALHSGKQIGRDEALDWINKQQWDEVRELSDNKDESSCISHILSRVVRVDGSKGQVTRSIGELIEKATSTGNYNEEHGITLEDAHAALRRMGIKCDLEHGKGWWVTFANRHSELQRILADTPWQAAYSRTLQRIAGAEKAAPAKFGGVPLRGVKIPLDSIM